MDLNDLVALSLFLSVELLQDKILANKVVIRKVNELVKFRVVRAYLSPTDQSSRLHTELTN